MVQLETWRCRRSDSVLDATRKGAGGMNNDLVVVAITTSSGCRGYSTALGARSSLITQTYLHDNFAPLFLGRSVHDREALWYDYQKLYRYWAFFPIYLPGPIDVAMWDIAAKMAGLPLYQYLGGYRTSLPTYPSSLFLNSADDYVALCHEYTKKGFSAFKAHPPGPWRKDREVHQALRDAFPTLTLMSDPVADYHLDEAIRVGRHLEKLDYHWFEEPFRDFEIDKYARLCSVLDIPVAGTESVHTLTEMAQAVIARSVDILRADVSWRGGVTGLLKAAHLAEAHGMRCEIHTTTMGPMDIANLHVSCAIKNCEYFELLVPEELFQFPMKDPYPIDHEGMIHVPQKPGLGIEFDWEGIEASCLEYKVTKF